MQIVLRMTADKFLVLRKGYVAFDNACAHSGGGAIAFLGMFRKLEGRAPMSDRELGSPHRLVGAAQQLFLQRAVGHPVDQKKRAGSDGDDIRGGGCRGQKNCGDQAPDYHRASFATAPQSSGRAVVPKTVLSAKLECICATPGRRVRCWRWMRA